MFDKGAFNDDGIIPLPGAAFSERGGDDGAVYVGGGDHQLSASGQPHVVQDEGGAEENGAALTENSTEPPTPGEMSMKFAAEVLPEFRTLTNVMQR